MRQFGEGKQRLGGRINVTRALNDGCERMADLLTDSVMLWSMSKWLHGNIQTCTCIYSHSQLYTHVYTHTHTHIRDYQKYSDFYRFLRQSLFHLHFQILSMTSLYSSFAQSAGAVEYTDCFSAEG